jgi:hypothetical protein
MNRCIAYPKPSSSGILKRIHLGRNERPQQNRVPFPHRLAPKPTSAKMVDAGKYLTVFYIGFTPLI